MDALADVRGQFHQLRSQALTVADAAGVPPAAQPESLHDIEPLLTAIGAALRERARREALEQAQQGAVAVLDRALEILHQDDPEFPALTGCHTKAREARAAILALTELESDGARQILDGVHAFADLLAVVEAREGLDDDRYAQLEASVSGAFGRALAVAAARGRLGFEGEFVEPPEPEPVAAEHELEPEPVAVESAVEPLIEAEVEPVEVEEAVEPSAPEPQPTAPVLEAPPLEIEETAPAPAPEPEPGPVAMAEVTAEPAPETELAPEPSGPDETAQWWLAAWARWSGWKASQDFASAVREELGKYPFLLSVPIQKSPEYEDGLLAYGYSILMDHVEKQNPGCVGNALNSLKPGHTRRVGEQLYDYLITEGRLRDTYADFVKNTLVAALPEPGVWFQFRILESKEDTRILQRPTARIGDTELSGKRLANDGQRYNEHKFKMTLGPLTTRFILVSADVKEARGAGFKLVANGAPSDGGWVVSVSAGSRSGAKIDAKRITEDGVHVPGLGKEHGSLWVAVFNPDPAADRRCELSVFLRKDTKSPFRGKG
ncbi:MAG TPA: hypothetical protein VN646_19240 [Candidatus Acidoferrum sp.]|nr:hypothetical protein [Candidatus Acidoferrum sp.]